MRKNLLIFLAFTGSACIYSQIKGDIVDLSRVALNSNPILKRNIISVKNAEADVQIQSSVFDYSLLSELKYQTSRYHLFDTDPRNSYLDEMLKTNNWDLSAGLQKKLRSSQIIEIGANYSFNNNNTPLNNYNQAIPLFRGDYTSILNFSITQPLLRGRGKRIATNPEKSSQIIVEMIKDQNVYLASAEILRLGLAYWNYYNAYYSLNIYKQNELRVRNVLEMTQELVKADKKPSGDLAQINADLINQEKLTIQAEQNLFNAKINLGEVVGINEAESTLIDIPIDKFPTLEESGFNQNINSKQLIELAFENRGDLSALQKNIEALELQREVAENNLKPALDLSGFAFYGNTSQGNGKSFQASTMFNKEGNYVGGGVKLTLNLSVNNNLAKGNAAQNKIQIEDQTIVNKNLRRVIELNISNSVNRIIHNGLAVQRSEEALKNYKIAFENEQSKFQTGLTTLLNVILFQERLTAAELDFIQTQLQYALAILNLRHETGTLLENKESIMSINKDSFYKIPTIQ